MNRAILVLQMIILLSACGLESRIASEVPYGESPTMPSQEVLDQLVSVPYQSLEVREDRSNPQKRIRTYYLDGELFSGWSKQIFLDSDHRYRYVKYENGIAVWQLGFYDNGNPDVDFHMKDAYNCGSQRMWLKEGSLYVDSYFLEGGIPHGKQMRWHFNGALARDALFNQGEVVYEVLFDQEGGITERKGEVPEKYKRDGF